MRWGSGGGATCVVKLCWCKSYYHTQETSRQARHHGLQGVQMTSKHRFFAETAAE